MIIQICVGSSCHLKGSEKIIKLFQNSIETNNLDAEIALAGCFCMNQCNHSGVTVKIDDVVFPGVTPEGFNEFFSQNVMSKIER